MSIIFVLDESYSSFKLFICREKFEEMLFALCKNEESDTASMRFFLQVRIFVYQCKQETLYISIVSRYIQSL